VADLEDLAGPARRGTARDDAANGNSPSSSGRGAANGGAEAAAGPREMLTLPLRAALGKQGYKLIGAHPSIPWPLCVALRSWKITIVCCPGHHRTPCQRSNCDMLMGQSGLLGSVYCEYLRIVGC